MVDLSLLEGTDWEEMFHDLLIRRYAGTRHLVQQVPAKDKGDAGLEAFSTDGRAYQCYGAEGLLATQALYEKQRDKMTRDVKKFIDNRTKLEPLFGTLKINTWILVVPKCESRQLLEHATTKTAEVVNAKLPYVDSQFAVRVHTAREYQAEYQMLIDSGLARVSLDPTPLATHLLHDWATQNDTLVNVVDDKLTRLPNPGANKQLARDAILKHFVQGEEIMESLKQDFPTLYQACVKCFEGFEVNLQTQSALGLNAPLNLHETFKELRSELERTAPTFTPATLNYLAWRGISDWIVRCPIDF